VGASRDELDRARRHAECAEGRGRQLVLLGRPHATAAQRRRTTRKLRAREDDVRCEPRVMETRRLEHAVGERARKHHDGVGVCQQGLGDHEEPAGAAQGERGAGDEQGDGEEEPPEPHPGRGYGRGPPRASEGP
jgi:hypothetical protein